MTAPVEFPVRAWRVEVTQKHINDGMCGDPKHCAVTKAIEDVEGMYCVQVRMREPEGNRRLPIAVARFDYEGKTYRVALPPEVGRFVVDFDMAKLVQPFVFEMNLGFAVPA